MHTRRELPPGRTALYRFHDVDGDLLYVGVSNDPQVRWESHERTKVWWPQVATRTIEWFPARDEALDAEDEAIQTEAPRYNQRQNPIAGLIEPDRQKRLAKLEEANLAIAEAEGDLAYFRRLADGRDDMVRRARAAGISKNRIHVLTGIARTTIDRILKEEG